MVWNQTAIKQLRLRYGWSLSDLARHLECETRNVRSFEHGEASPESNMLNKLEMLLRNLEQESENMAQTPKIETYLESYSFTQVDSDLLK